MLAIKILGQVRLRWATAVSNGDMHDGLLPGDLHREPAALAARGVQDSVAGQFSRDADHIVARRALGQHGCQPSPHHAKLTFLAFEHLLPAGGVWRNR
jgi:hypothetical protein